MIMEVGTRIIERTGKLSEHLKASVLACFFGVALWCTRIEIVC